MPKFFPQYAITVLLERLYRIGRDIHLFRYLRNREAVHAQFDDLTRLSRKRGYDIAYLAACFGRDDQFFVRFGRDFDPAKDLTVQTVVTDIVSCEVMRDRKQVGLKVDHVVHLRAVFPQEYERFVYNILTGVALLHEVADIIQQAGRQIVIRRLKCIDIALRYITDLYACQHKTTNVVRTFVKSVIQG